MKRVALLGCGYIGTQLAQAIDTGQIPARLERIYDASYKTAEKMAAHLSHAPKIVANPHLLSYPPVDIVVEAASQEAVRDVALSVVQNRRDMMVMSVGALMDESIFDVLQDACADFHTRIYLPSGAIGGLDAIAAARGHIDSISITTTKNPASLRGAPHLEMEGIDIENIHKHTILYKGSAIQAVRRFPANANVAGAISLAAGLDADVTVAADPDISANMHHITVQGDFGTMEFRVINKPEPTNPKTSRLAALSAIRRLYNYCTDGIHI